MSSPSFLIINYLGKQLLLKFGKPFLLHNKLSLPYHLLNNSLILSIKNQVIQNNFINPISTLLQLRPLSLKKEKLRTIKYQKRKRYRITKGYHKYKTIAIIDRLLLL